MLPVTPLLIREEVMDELLVADESPLAGQLDEPPNDATLYAEYRRLAAEQAALRRLATLVARGVEPWTLRSELILLWSRFSCAL